MNWVRSYEGRGEYAEDLGGVVWFDAPKPRLWHRCQPHTRGLFVGYGLTERCACGATRVDGAGPWLGRNTRGRA